MSNYDSLYQSGLYLSSEQQDLLYAALSSSNHFSKGQHGESATMNPLNSNLHPPQGRHQHQNQPRKQSSPSSGAEVFDSPSEEAIGSARLDMDFLDADLDFNAGESLFGDLPEEPEPEIREKRKSIDGNQNEEGGKKRKENETKVPKKPGRKPLTSEPTSVGVLPQAYMSRFTSVLTDIVLHRSERPRTERPNGRFAIAKKNTSRTSKPKSRKWSRSHRPPTTRIACCVRKWSDCRLNSRSIVSAFRGSAAATASRRHRGYTMGLPIPSEITQA